MTATASKRTAKTTTTSLRPSRRNVLLREYFENALLLAALKESLQRAASESRRSVA